MKVISFASVLALVLAANAQAPQTVSKPAIAPTEKAQVVAKKSKKKKKAPQTSEVAPQSSATVTTTAAGSEAPTLTESKPAVPAATEVTPAAGSTATTAPATNTTTTAATEAAPPAKKWSASITLNPSSDYTDSNSVSMLTSLGFGYKITDKSKVSMKQTFETVAPENESGENRNLVNSNNFRAAYTDLGVSTSLGGVAGSDSTTMILNARMMNNEAIYTKGANAPIETMYDLNTSLPYTITPAISAELFAQIRHYQNKIGQTTSPTEGHKLNRFLATGSLSYAFTDAISIYQAVGGISSYQEGLDLRRYRERAYFETGVSITPPAVKGLSITMDINQDKMIATRRDGEAVSKFSLYKPNENASGEVANDLVSYEAIVSYAF